VVTVGAIDVKAKVWANSDTAPYVSLTAPGVRLIGKDPQAASGYGYSYGTSPATAIVSGAIADVRARFPSESSRRIVARVLYTARQLQGTAHTHNDDFGYGVVLPSLAMLRSVPADAPNPVFDAVGLTRSNTEGAASTTTSTTSAPADATDAPTAG
jgi:subtilisin family serine protease